jgi:hypothetical protein
MLLTYLDNITFQVKDDILQRDWLASAQLCLLFLVRWQANAASLPQGDIILPC